MSGRMARSSQSGLEKPLAAHRGGTTTVLIAPENENDLVEIPDDMKDTRDTCPVKRSDEVLAIARERGPRR